MKCSACGWTNPASYTTCFSCNAALTGAPATSATTGASKPSGGTLNSPKATPWDPRAAAAPPVKAAHTPGTVEDQDVIAGKLPRIFAAGIDLVMMAVMAGALIAVSAAVGVSLNDAGLSWLAMPLAALCVGIAIVLPALLDSFSVGSLGKRLLNLRVITAHGKRPGATRSVLRHFIKYTSHFVLPLGLIVIENLFLGGRSLHDLLLSTRVIDRRASARQIDRIVATEFGPTVVGAAFKLVAFAAVACAAVAISVIVFNAFIATSNPAQTAAQTAALEATQALAKSAKLLAKQSENHYYAEGSFPASLSALGLSKLPEDFATVQFNPTSGAFTLTLSNKTLPVLAGKTLTLYPEFKQKKGAGNIKKWRCGSKDIARDVQPFACRDDVMLLN